MPAAKAEALQQMWSGYGDKMEILRSATRLAGTKASPANRKISSAATGNGGKDDEHGDQVRQAPLWKEWLNGCAQMRVAATSTFTVASAKALTTNQAAGRHRGEGGPAAEPGGEIGVHALAPADSQALVQGALERRAGPLGPLTEDHEPGRREDGETEPDPGDRRANAALGDRQRR